MKEFEIIRKQAAKVLGDYPERKAELQDQLRTAQDDLSKAKEALEGAESMEEYDKAAEAVKRSEMAVIFAEKALQKLSKAPRMGEEKYFEAVDEIKHKVAEAVAVYQESAEALMDQLFTVRDSYLKTIHEADSTLAELDLAANILQTKHEYRVMTFVDAPDVKVPDPEEWKRHAVRYDDAAACEMAVTASDGMRGSVLATAWGAVSKAYPRKKY